MAFPLLLGIAAGCLVSSLLIALSTRYWRLRHIDGPVLAAFTDLWRARIQFFGPFAPSLLDLHRKYGTLVRIGPNTVSIGNPDLISAIASPRGGFAKADSYSPMRVFVNGKSVGSIIDMQDEDKNRAIKRAVGGAFIAKTAVADYEGAIQETLDDLVRNIQTQHLGKPFHLYDLLQFFQLDFLFKFAFGESLGHLDENRDVSGVAKALTKRAMHWYFWQPLPRLERFIFQNRLWSKHVAMGSRWVREGALRIETRLAERGTITTSPHRDLLQKYLDASEKHPDAIPPDSLRGLVNSTISAGADTTAGTAATIFYTLLKHPRVLNRLLQELHDARRAGHLALPIRYAMVEHLPYLDAVIRETMRLHPPLAVPLERVVPPQGCRLGFDGSDGVFLPGGTVVALAAYVMHQHGETFGADAGVFRPERFLGRNKWELQAMERASLSFGLANRICIGRHIAEMEIKMLVPTLLLKFDFELCDPDLEIHFENFGIFEMDFNTVFVVASNQKD